MAKEILIFFATACYISKEGLSMRQAEMASGFLSILLGITLIIAASNFPVLPTVDVGPAFFPKVVGGILIFFGALLAIVAFLNKAESKSLKEIFNRRSLLAIGTIAIFAIYIILVSVLGFLIATPLLVIGLAMFLKGKNIAVIVIVAVAVTLLIYYLFLKFLLIPLPRGIFF